MFWGDLWAAHSLRVAIPMTARIGTCVERMSPSLEKWVWRPTPRSQMFLNNLHHHIGTSIHPFALWKNRTIFGLLSWRRRAICWRFCPRCPETSWLLSCETCWLFCFSSWLTGTLWVQQKRQDSLLRIRAKRKTLHNLKCFWKKELKSRKAFVFGGRMFV